MLPPADHRIPVHSHQIAKHWYIKDGKTITRNIGCSDVSWETDGVELFREYRYKKKLTAKDVENITINRSDDLIEQRIHPSTESTWSLTADGTHEPIADAFDIEDNVPVEIKATLDLDSSPMPFDVYEKVQVNPDAFEHRPNAQGYILTSIEQLNYLKANNGYYMLIRYERTEDKARGKYLFVFTGTMVPADEVYMAYKRETTYKFKKRKTVAAVKKQSGPKPPPPSGGGGGRRSAKMQPNPNARQSKYYSGVGK